MKHRDQTEIRIVPVPSELVRLLRVHLTEYGTGSDGRLFRTDVGEAIQESTYTAVWRRARRRVFTKRRLRAMRGIKTMTGLRTLASGHAFVQNLRRGHYEIAVDEPAGRRLAVAFTDLARAI